MTRRDRAFTLLEVLLAATTLVVVVFLLGKLFVDGLYLQRVAADRSDRDAAIAALVDQLRYDALGASKYSWIDGEESDMLTLSTYADGAPRVVRYEIAPKLIRRFEGGNETGAFAAHRLEFAASASPGRYADVLDLELTPPPPPRAYHSAPRVVTESIVLPGASGVATHKEDEQP